MKKASNMNNINTIAYCGLYCGACDKYLHTAGGGLQKLSEKNKIPAGLLHCEGCRAGRVSIYCINCSIRKCCQKKGIFSCSDCDEFPCSVLKAFESDEYLHHTGIIESLLKLKRTGQSKWIEHQISKWKCKNCGQPVSWYEKMCDDCKGRARNL